MWRRPRPFSGSAYKTLIRKLLSKHGLRVPEGTIEMLTKTLISCRRGWQPTTGQDDTRQRLRMALVHAEALRRYIKKPPERPTSIATRSESLRAALDGLDAVVWLAVSVPPIDVSSLLDRLDTDGLDGEELTRLLQAIDYALAANGKRTGRPVERATSVVRAGCIAWFRAGRRDSYNTWSRDFAAEPLPSFLRDLLHCCWLDLSAEALYSATKAARRDIRNRYTQIAS
jgi:hypothetical protein